MRHLDLFSGIGGFALAARRVGWETVAFCENDPWCREVLAKNFPGVEIHDDIRRFTGRPVRDTVLTAGWPCQDLSLAGRLDGIDGERSGLWSELARVIGEARPRFAVLENVTNLLAGERGYWFQRVLGDLAEVGYGAEWHCIPAARIGAPHRRDRVWIIAYPDMADPGSTRGSIGVPGQDERQKGQPRISQHLSAQIGGEAARRAMEWWATEPDVGRVANGVPRRVDRLRGLGNAIVPQVAETIFRSILEGCADC